MTLVQKRRNGDLMTTPTRDLFGSGFFGSSIFDINDFFEGSQTPPANLSEKENEFLVDLSAPGLKRNDFKVSVENGYLTISCEKKEEFKDEKENYKRMEFSYNSFSRSFHLPDNVIEDKINAKYEDGILHISIPKKEVTFSKHKEIQVA